MLTEMDPGGVRGSRGAKRKLPFSNTDEMGTASPIDVAAEIDLVAPPIVVPVKACMWRPATVVTASGCPRPGWTSLTMQVALLVVFQGSTVEKEGGCSCFPAEKPPPT